MPLFRFKDDLNRGRAKTSSKAKLQTNYLHIYFSLLASVLEDMSHDISSIGKK